MNTEIQSKSEAQELSIEEALVTNYFQALEAHNEALDNLTKAMKAGQTLMGNSEFDDAVSKQMVIDRMEKYNEYYQS